MPNGLPQMMDDLVAKHAKKGFANRWVRTQGANTTHTNAHVMLTKAVGWEPVAGNVTFGDVQLFEMPHDHYKKRQGDKFKAAKERTRSERIGAALEVETAALKEKHVFPTGNDGGEIDYDKKYRAKGKTIAVRPVEED